MTINTTGLHIGLSVIHLTASDNGCGTYNLTRINMTSVPHSITFLVSPMSKIPLYLNQQHVGSISQGP